MVSKQFLALARDNNRWRFHCYDQSWSSEKAGPANGRASESIAMDSTAPLSSLGHGSLLSLIRPHDTRSTTIDSGEQDESAEFSARKRSRAAATWDPSFEGEDVDWYSEYIARHGPISFSWLQHPFTRGVEEARKYSREVKGLGLLKDLSSAGQDRVVGPLGDGSICIWDLSHGSQPTRGRILGTSPPGVLTADYFRRRNNPASKSALEFMNLGECVSVDSIRRRAYLAVGNALNEVDLETLKVVSQQRYPWSIFALSQETDYSAQLTLATMVSLHLYDCRLSAQEEEDAMSHCCENAVATRITDSPLYPRPDSHALRLQTRDRARRIRSPDPFDKETDYAPLFQPGPLSVLHPPAPHVNSILLAGRFPSVLSYDRRFLPRLQSSAHSGGRLCGLAPVPAPKSPIVSDTMCGDTHNVVACGEYNGRGSLELYGLTSSNNSSDNVPTEVSPRLYTMYRNRQSAARSKLLSVASHGTRIVYSDADGNIKWVERDGRVEIRRWNINSDRLHIGASAPDSENDETQGATGLWSSLSADSQDNNEVARKVLPAGGNLTEDELLLWTGDRIGCMRFSQPDELDEQEDESEDMSIDEEVDNSLRNKIRQQRRHQRQQENEYAGMMRKALEIQADEVRWMGRLGLA